jgi:hypothetical protein
MDRITALHFIDLVTSYHPQWNPEYIGKCINGVITGKYPSIAPAAGTDIFYIRRNIDSIIAPTRPRSQEIRRFELIA